jgi:hypothetical protein
MKKSAKVVITKERTIHTYAELWYAADCVLRAGQKNAEGSAWQFLSSLVLTAFSLEAYLNHVGAKTFECWEEVAKLPPLGKLDLLAETLGVKFKGGNGARPLQTLSRLFSFRNAIAHGRTSEVKYKSVTRDVDNYQAEYHAPLLADWEQLIRSDEFACRAREDVEAVMRIIQSGRKGSTDNLFTTGVGSAGATLVSEP